jgi:hypothetical protein
MSTAAWRLLLCAVLFVGWLAYLGYQVVTRPHYADGRPLVVSRPQVLVSQVDVIADVPDTDGTVTVREVLWPEDAPVKAGDRIKVTNLEECRPSPRPGETGQPPADFSGPGAYLLPLRKGEKDTYEVAPIPPSPGFNLSEVLDGGPPRIYPATHAALAQYRTIAKPE